MASQGYAVTEVYGYLAAVGTIPKDILQVVQLPMPAATLVDNLQIGVVVGPALAGETNETVAGLLPLFESGMAVKDALEAARLLAVAPASPH